MTRTKSFDFGDYPNPDLDLRIFEMIRNAVESIGPRYRLCLERDGRQFEHL